MTATAAVGLLLAHLPVALVVVWITWRWRQRLQRPMPAGRWLLALVSDSTAILTALMLGIAILAGRGALGFLVLRFASQVLFGEVLLALAAAAALHFVTRPGGGAPLRGRGALLAAAAVVLLGVYVEAYHHCPYDLQVRYHAWNVTRGREPAGVLRVLHLTDLQTHAIRDYERSVFARAAALKPDLVVFTGDYLQSRSATNRREGADDFRALIRDAGFKPRYGFYATQGDCEKDTGWRRLFEGLDVTCLANESKVIHLPGDRSIVLTGLTRHTSRFPTKSELDQALAEAPPGDRRIVIGHAPDFVSLLDRPSGIDLVLAGHTHGGQIVVPGFGPPITFSVLPRRFAGDLHLYRDTPLHVSRGIGMERGYAPQIRFMCPPEICLIDVRY